MRAYLLLHFISNHVTSITLSAVIITGSSRFPGTSVGKCDSIRVFVVAQPKQILVRDPLPKTTLDRIVRAQELMISNPSTGVIAVMARTTDHDSSKLFLMLRANKAISAWSLGNRSFGRTAKFGHRATCSALRYASSINQTHPRTSTSSKSLKFNWRRRMRT
jgi:hypothetical protein